MVKPMLYFKYTGDQIFGSIAVSVFWNFEEKWHYYCYWYFHKR